MKIGIGYDVHQLTEDRLLILGGVEIPHTLGLLGHSDADVLTHAIMDAILGALGMGDIGKHFPDSSQAFKDISSLILLDRVCETMAIEGYRIGNVDATIVAQKPKLSPYIDEMRRILANHLKCDVKCVNIKATTTEKLGFEGQELGMSSQAVVLLVKAEEATNV
ncbi:MAG TPA: 2-C-methyl-D-erythritol 2,4-cyclodiphosphate synthase [Clostridiales bacterium UBA8960]|jgi:2-C-methyl-D-erythritol 2,4-cyclodiphosphate synthase|nr:2-C-methyl-D-erythritol 2,4-cyclodiphosphate synthase [Clostridiales bacterium UBA8960]